MPAVVKLMRSICYPTGEPVPIVYYSNTRVNATAASTSSAEAALPTGFRVIEIRATDFIWLRFGNTGMGSAAADSNSVLFAGGEKVFQCH